MVGPHVMTIHRVVLVMAHLVTAHRVVTIMMVPHMMIACMFLTHLVMRNAALMPLSKVRLATLVALLAPFAFASKPLRAAVKPRLTLVSVIVPVVDTAASWRIEIGRTDSAQRRANGQDGRKDSQRKSTLHT